MKATRIGLSEAQRAELKNGYCKGERHYFRMLCLAVLLKTEGLSSAKAGEKGRDERAHGQLVAKEIPQEGGEGAGDPPGAKPQAYTR